MIVTHKIQHITVGSQNKSVHSSNHPLLQNSFKICKNTMGIFIGLCTHTHRKRLIKYNRGISLKYNVNTVSHIYRHRKELVQPLTRNFCSVADEHGHAGCPRSLNLSRLPFSLH